MLFRKKKKNKTSPTKNLFSQTRRSNIQTTRTRWNYSKELQVSSSSSSTSLWKLSSSLGVKNGACTPFRSACWLVNWKRLGLCSTHLIIVFLFLFSVFFSHFLAALWQHKFQIVFNSILCTICVRIFIISTRIYVETLWQSQLLPMTTGHGSWRRVWVVACNINKWNEARNIILTKRATHLVYV